MLQSDVHFQLDFPFLLLRISQNWNSAFTIAFFWVGFPVSAVKYFWKLGFCIYHSFFCIYYAREYSADVSRISCLWLKELIKDKWEGGGRRDRISRDVLWGKFFIGVTPPNREAECLVRKGVGLWTIFWAVATPVPASLFHSIPFHSILITSKSTSWCFDARAGALCFYGHVMFSPTILSEV